MNLRRAYLLADRIKTELALFCDRIEIAGSIRRAREHVNDIDLVILPKAGQIQAIKDRCLRKSTLVRDGDQNFIVRLPNDVQLDLFFARPEVRELLWTLPCNWGSILLCRTGSKEHNIMLCDRAKDMGLKWDPYRGLLGPSQVDGPLDKVIAAETEESIFEALGMTFIPPVMREITTSVPVVHSVPAP